MDRWEPQGLIGVVHLPALPGDPVYDGRSFKEILDYALIDADALVAGGLKSIIIENFGSAPFPKGNAAQPMPPHHTSMMTIAAYAIHSKYPDIHLGINCLRNDAIAALGIASATGADFIRVNVLSGAYVTDQGVIEGDAYNVLRYRSQLGLQHVSILADILVKHATPLAPLSATDSTKDTLHRGHADAVIVTGSGTGEPVDRRILEEVSRAASGKPIFLGSGTRPETIANYASFVKGAIVGTSLKYDGIVSNPVDADRVRRMVKAFDAVCKTNA